MHSAVVVVIIAIAADPVCSSYSDALFRIMRDLASAMVSFEWLASRRYYSWHAPYLGRCSNDLTFDVASFAADRPLYAEPCGPLGRAFADDALMVLGFAALMVASQLHCPYFAAAVVAVAAVVAAIVVAVVASICQPQLHSLDRCISICPRSILGWRKHVRNCN